MCLRHAWLVIRVQWVIVRATLDVNGMISRHLATSNEPLEKTVKSNGQYGFGRWLEQSIYIGLPKFRSSTWLIPITLYFLDSAKNMHLRMIMTSDDSDKRE